MKKFPPHFLPRHLAFLLLTLCMIACGKQSFENYPDSLSDDFEAAVNQETLFKAEGGKWSAPQLTEGDNNLFPDTSRAHSGNQALFCTAAPSVDGASKCSIFNNELSLEEGKIFHFSAWYFLEGTQSVDYLFLADLEERTTVGASPGVRIALEDSVGYLVMERNKINASTLYQEEGNRVAFPRDKWVHLEWEMDLQRKEKGSVRVWQDGQLLITASGIKNMPRDRLYFAQGTKGIYSNIEVGITANTKDSSVRLWVDDVEVWLE